MSSSSSPPSLLLDLPFPAANFLPKPPSIRFPSSPLSQQPALPEELKHQRRPHRSTLTMTTSLLLLCFLVTSALITNPTGAVAPQPSPPPNSIGPAPSLPPPPKGTVDCSTVIYDMMDCLDYVTAGSNTSKPDESCCEGIKAVVQLSPTCVCEALQEAANMKIDINMTRAIALPTVCNVAAPTIDSCRIATPPAGAPAPSKSNVPSPASLPPSLPVPVPSSTPVVPSARAQPPTAAHTPSAAAAPFPSGSSSLPFSLVVLVICLAAPPLLSWVCMEDRP